MKAFRVPAVQCAAGWIVAGLLFTMEARTQWSNDPNVNTAVSTLIDGQYYHRSVSDGVGGVIITWEDRRSLFGDIYAQRINASGVVQWAVNGTVICNANNIQELPAIAGDGAGGAIIAWMDRRNGNNDIYAQRINASGVVQWAANGVAITVAASDQVSPAIISDGAGGAIVVWEDTRNGLSDIYAQRINASGGVQWTADGVTICSAAQAQRSHAVVGAGAGGAIITWQDSRSGGGDDIYAQRVSASGAVQWIANGVEICTASNGQQDPGMASDSAGGAIISWQDLRNGTFDIFAQRIDSSGAVLWTANGVVTSAAGGHQYSPVLVSDGASGAIITWEDRRASFVYDVYAQRITDSGAVQWTANGVAIGIAADNHQSPAMVTDDGGGAIITWYDSRSGSSNNDIYAQRINASGVVQWTVNGVGVSTATSNQMFPAIVGDGAGGAIIAWDDTRNAVDNIFAQQISASGLLGVVTGVLNEADAVPGPYRLEQNYPNPFNPTTSFRFQVPSSKFVELRVFDVLGRDVATLVNGEIPRGTHSVTWNAQGVAAGVYLYRLQTGSFIETKKLLLLK